MSADSASTPQVPADAAIGTNVVVAPSALQSVRESSVVELDDETHHHLSRVLRLRPNDRITLTDGFGRWVEAALSANFGSSSAAVTVTSACRIAPEPPNVGIAVALTKGDKPETVVQKLTELGVRRIVFVPAERSVVRWDDEKAERNRVRLAAVARSALGQCRGAWLPVIESLSDVATLARQPGVVRADRGGRALAASDQLIAIGPEGGWSTRECDLLPDVVELPGLVLRAETAAIVGAAVAMAMRMALAAQREPSPRGQTD